MDTLFKRLCVFLSAVLIISSFSMFFAIPSYVKSERSFDLFAANAISENIENMEINLTSTIYVRNSKGEWEEYQRIHGNENRIWVSIDKMPQQLIDAFISIEDERFYKHRGVDWKRTVAAAGNLLFKYYSSNQGGSTITQQLIKNITNDNDESPVRKVREITRALIIEGKLNKKKILEAYLNTISLGNGICGVQVAANYYFNKDVSELSLVECAAIAAITKNPSKYSPDQSENNKMRRNTVLYKMMELGKITPGEYSAASTADITLDNSQQENYEAEVNNYFVDALIAQVIRDLSVKYGCSEQLASSMLYNGGYKIYATLDTKIQSVMEDVYTDIKTYFRQTSRKDKTVHAQSAMTVMDYEGHIMGIVGGAGEKKLNRGLNRATDSPRQPGSTMKPLGVYALAIDTNTVNYSSKVLDKPIENYYKDGKAGPKEWYGYYKGNITVQYAIEKSANTIPVRLLQEIGIDKSFDFLVNKLGCKHLTEVDKNPASLGLGGCEYGITTTESAAAYAIFGNQGKYYKPTTYYKIEKANGEVVIDSTEPGTQVISPESATIMNKLLQRVVYGGEGTGKSIAGYNKMPVYAKTGTSSESNDLWMAAGTPYYVGSVWYGFDTPEKLNDPGAAAKIWKAVMQSIHKGLESKKFEDSEGVVSAKYCTSTGLLAAEGCGSAAGYYKKDALPAKCGGKHAATPSETPSSAPPSSSSSPASSENPSSEAPSSSQTPSSSEETTPENPEPPGGGEEE